MKKKFNIAGLLMALMAVLTASCIQDEALNAEADILTCNVEGSLLIRQPVITNDEIKLYVNGWDDVTAIAPTFTLTEGAVIEPASGTVRDFTQPQTYVVTSQDDKWKKTYKVSAVSNDVATEYHFENVKFYTTGSGTAEKQHYHIFIDTTADGNEMEWGSGNSGFMITNSSAAASKFPTSQDENGFIGKCAKLQTVSTGFFGALVGAPIAAGNLFTGSFVIDMGNMAKSTHFGQPFRKYPGALTGYYKYTAGTKYTDKNNREQKDKHDTFDIYAVLFEVTKEVPYLDGTNSLTSPNIVMMARIEDKQETTEWTRFSIPFKLLEGKSVDADKLKNGQYSLAIVMSSSIEGATFNGAVGSTLWVDELQLYYDEEEAPAQ